MLVGVGGKEAVLREREGDDDNSRSACRRNQEHFICFSSIMCMYKKLLLGR